MLLILKQKTTNKEGYSEYKSPKHTCATCSFFIKVYRKQRPSKSGERHQNYMEEADHMRHHKDVKPIYAKRKETIERVFADAKEKHGMRWTTLRGLKKLSMLWLHDVRWPIGHGKV
ncbi:transposase [Peribacillus simplex]|uniref:transposase n=1 Tax=Peribacillus simplex TaxID=1478 RepID=UPI003D2B5133